jgi:tetratricopeptide (TPR) repeat protein
MRRYSLLLCAGIVAMLGADPLPAGRDGRPSQLDELDPKVTPSLLVQSAMQQGRESLARGEHRTAVRVLEAHLARINGNSIYLSLLEDAYRGYIKELRQKGQDELAQRYLERLAILDPGVQLQAAVRPPTSPAPPADPAEKLVVRGRSEEEKASASVVLPRAASVADLLAQAERDFQAKRYAEAGALYQKAYLQDKNLAAASRERWAYCKLHWVTQQINQPAKGGPDWLLLETEVRTALSLAPRLEYGQTLLKKIEEASPKSGEPKAVVNKSRYPVQHQPEKVNGWHVSDSPNFRVYHSDSALAEEVLQTAEQTRAAVLQKWLEEKSAAAWPARCEIFLHASANAYAHATGTPADSPGHSSIGAEKQDASRIHSRRIDLHVDEVNMLRAVLPHETTHVTLAGLFGPRPLPRWADEGIAVLSEPYDRIQRHLRPLFQAFAEDRVFTAEQLMRLDEYPTPDKMASFYGQSTTLVQFLTELRGPTTLVAFLRSAQREGYPKALERHYGLTLGELEERWRHYVVVDQVPGLNLAARQ